MIEKRYKGFTLEEIISVGIAGTLFSLIAIAGITHKEKVINYYQPKPIQQNLYNTNHNINYNNEVRK